MEENGCADLEVGEGDPISDAVIYCDHLYHAGRYFFDMANLKK